jgi:hypothetical protein
MSRLFLRIVLPVFAGLLIYSSARAADLTFDEFGSAYYGQALSYGLRPYGFPSSFPGNRPDFTNFSLFGLNINGKFDDHWSAGAQLVALGDSSVATNTSFATFNVEASWAFVTYKTDEGTTVRGGRQRFPIFTASEYIYEHYQLPYREMPAIIFQMAPFVAFDGASVSHEFDTGAGKVNVQLFGGTPVLETTPAAPNTTAQLSNLIGARVNFEGDGWRVRAQASRSSSQSTSTTTNAVLAQADSSYYSAGYRYDKYNIVSWGEYIFRHAPDGTQTAQGKYLGTGSGGYLLGGYRIGNFLPRYTFAQAVAQLGSVGNGKTTTHTVGVNYYAGEHAVIKAEYELDVVPTDGGGYKVIQPDGTSVTSGSAVYAGVDFFF